MVRVVLALFFVAVAGYVSWITVEGLRNGVMEPITRGFSLKVERELRPVGFWVAAVWNALWIGLCVWGAVGSAFDR